MIAEAERQAAAIRTEADSLAARLRREGYARADSLEARATGVRKLAAKLVHPRIAQTFELGSQGDSFDPIVLSGPNSALPHGVASDRVLREGDLLSPHPGSEELRLRVREAAAGEARRRTAAARGRQASTSTSSSRCTPSCWPG